MGQTGPLVRRLESFDPLIGLVVGAFQEGSKDLHSLLDTMADSQLRARGLARGRQGTDQERRAEESPELNSYQGPLLLHPRQDIAGMGVPQAGSKEESLAEEGGGNNAGGNELFLAGG